MIGGGAWARYPRCPGATAIGTAAVTLLRGGRADEGARLRGARREQDDHWQRTGYVGGHVELATAARLVARDTYGYSPGHQEYCAQMASLGRRYNWQGQRRLAQLTGVSRRSAQRYRARMQEDGLLDSQRVLPGDMLDDMRAPVTRTHVVRDIQPLIDEANQRRRREPKRRRPGRGHMRQKPKRPRPERKPALERTAIARPAPDEPTSAEEIREFMRSSLSSASSPEREQPARPFVETIIVGGQPCPATIDPATIDEWERDTESLEHWLEWRRKRERPPPD